MNKINILSGTLFQREVSGSNFLGMGLVELDESVKEKEFYVFDNKNLYLFETGSTLSGFEKETYKSSCVSSLFKSIQFEIFPEYNHFTTALLIPVENNVYFIMTISKENTIFGNDKGDNFYSVQNNSFVKADMNIKSLGDSVLNICRKPLWSAGKLKNISFEGFTTESFSYYKKSQVAFNQFLNGEISKKKFCIINENNFNFIMGYDNAEYLQVIKTILKYEPDFLINHKFYFSEEEFNKRSQLFKISMQECIEL